MRLESSSHKSALPMLTNPTNFLFEVLALTGFFIAFSAAMLSMGLHQSVRIRGSLLQGYRCRSYDDALDDGADHTQA
jgi:hypothetical protein